MDCRRGPQTHATSVTTQEGNKMRVWGLSFWLWVAHSPTCFAQGLGSEFWKHGTFNDLQQFVSKKRRQTTSSVPICPLLSHSPGFYLCSAFKPGLKAEHWNCHGPEEALLQTKYLLVLLFLSYKKGQSGHRDQRTPSVLHLSLLVTFRFWNLDFVCRGLNF